jgi:hypothetical protein
MESCQYNKVPVQRRYLGACPEAVHFFDLKGAFGNPAGDSRGSLNKDTRFGPEKSNKKTSEN